MDIIICDPHITPEHLGSLPFMLDDRDPRPASQQFNDGYAHGGGWRSIDAGQLRLDRYTLHYPGDPPLQPIAIMTLRDEVILFYPYALVCIVQADQSFEVCRMD